MKWKTWKSGGKAEEKVATIENIINDTRSKTV